MTSTEYRIQKLEAALVAIDALETAGVAFYGPNAVAIDDAKAAIDRELTSELWNDYLEQAS